jgi:hypothetical protein
MTTRFTPPVLSIPRLPTQVIDPATVPRPRQVWKYEIGAEHIRALDIDSQSAVVAVGASDGVVRVLGLERGEPAGQHHTDGFVWDVAFSTDGRHLSAIGVQAEMYRWEWRSGSVLVDGVRPGRPSANSRPALSPDGSTVATQHVDGIAVWDLNAMQLRFKTEPQGSVAVGLAFDEDGRRLMACAGGSVPMVVYRHHDGCLAMLPRDQQRWSGVTRNSQPPVQMWDTVEGVPVGLADPMARYPGSNLHLRADGTVVFSRGLVVESLDWRNAARIGPTLRPPGRLQGMRGMQVAGDWAIVTGGGWYVLDWRTGNVLGGRYRPNKPTTRSPKPFRACVDPRRAIAVVSFDDGWVRAYRLPTPKPGGERSSPAEEVK